MADLGFTFNNDDAPEDEFADLPVGDYVCMITESAMKPTRAGTGEYIGLRVEVVEGERAGRLMFENLNIKNPNEIAVKIALQKIAEINKAFGMDTVKNTEEWHNKRVLVTVSLDKKGQTRTKFKPVNEQSTSQGTAKTSDSSSADNTPPWGK